MSAASVRPRRRAARVPGVAVLAAALLAAACAGPEPPASGGGPSVDPATVPGRIVLELWQLRGGVTLGGWATTNLNDELTGPDSAYQGDLGRFCARAVVTVELAGRLVQRQAYFYPPAAPADLALPDSGSAERVRECVLGAIRVVVPTPDSARGAALGDSVRGQMARAFGAGVEGPLSFFRSAFWIGAARFARDSLTAVAAFEALPAAADTARARTRVLAFAFLPASGLSLDPGSAVAGEYTPADTVPLDSAAAIAGLDSALWAPLRALVHDARPWSAERRAAAELLGPLRRWLGAAAALPPARRAAALYLADQVLERVRCAFPLCESRDSLQLAPLRALGAGFTWTELGGAWTYTRTWLTQARLLDRDSPLGQRILLAQLNAGMDFSGTCAAGAEAFRAVIQTGERYLERVPAGPIAADVHFVVGEAYRDVVALAAGAGDVYADASRYTGEAPEARRRALSHYRAAIAAAPGGPAARAAWRQAWWLMAGLAPRETRFYCVYD